LYNIRHRAASRRPESTLRHIRKAVYAAAFAAGFAAAFFGAAFFAAGFFAGAAFYAIS
jgi:hypothetical protein